jgi:hypothetical protein
VRSTSSTTRERLRLIVDDDEAVASFLESLEDVRGPRERELLRELARREPVAEPDLFPTAHRHATAALESLARHGYHSANVTRRLGPLRPVARYLIELVARYLVVSHLRQVATDMRNLYWAREMASDPASDVRAELERARIDAEALLVILKRRPIGLPSFVFGGVILSATATAWRAATGVAFGTWWAALVTGAIAAVLVLAASWVILRGSALASRRIRLSVRVPLQRLWEAVGNCHHPPRDQSARFAAVAITLTVAAWIVLPAAVAIALAV